MNIFSDPINLLLMVAAITILLWLRSVLGRRGGFERNEKPLESLPSNPKPSVQLGQTARISDADLSSFFEPGISKSAGFETVRKLQPDFDAGHFLAGAKTAHEMILVAFAEGDKKAMKPLLNKSVFDSFENAINENQKAGQAKLFKFVGVKNAKIANVEIEKKMISIGVNFESDIISGEEKSVSTQKEHWVFEKELNSKDPNWKLAATQDPGAEAQGLPK